MNSSYIAETLDISEGTGLGSRNILSNESWVYTSISSFRELGVSEFDFGIDSQIF